MRDDLIARLKAEAHFRPKEWGAGRTTKVELHEDEFTLVIAALTAQGETAPAPQYTVTASSLEMPRPPYVGHEDVSTGSTTSLAAAASSLPAAEGLAPAVLAAADRNPRIAEQLRNTVARIELGELSIGRAAECSGLSIAEIMAIHAALRAVAEGRR